MTELTQALDAMKPDTLKSTRAAYTGALLYEVEDLRTALHKAEQILDHIQTKGQPPKGLREALKGIDAHMSDADAMLDGIFTNWKDLVG